MEKDVLKYLEKRNSCVKVNRYKNDEYWKVVLFLPKTQKKSDKTIIYEYNKSKQMMSVFVNDTVKNITCDYVLFVTIMNIDIIIKIKEHGIDTSLLLKDDTELTSKEEKAKVSYYQKEIENKILQNNNKIIEQCEYTPIIVDLFKCGGIK